MESNVTWSARIFIALVCLHDLVDWIRVLYFDGRITHSDRRQRRVSYWKCRSSSGFFPTISFPIRRDVVKLWWEIERNKEMLFSLLLPSDLYIVLIIASLIQIVIWTNRKIVHNTIRKASIIQIMQRKHFYAVISKLRLVDFSKICCV